MSIKTVWELENLFPQIVPHSTKADLERTIESLRRLHDSIGMLIEVCESFNGRNLESNGDEGQFRTRERALQRDILLLSLFERRRPDSLSPSLVKRAVEEYFEQPNQHSVYAKLSEYKDNGILDWNKSDRRYATEKTKRELENSVKLLSDEEEVKSINKFVEKYIESMEDE